MRCIGDLPGKLPSRAWSARVPRHAAQDTRARRNTAFRDGLRELGYVEGENLVVEQRYAAGQVERLPARLGVVWNASNASTAPQLKTVQAAAPALGPAEGGLLMSYGTDFAEMFRQGTVLVDKILKGAKPADLPVAQPTKFELTINAKTAKTLGLTIPPSVAARADSIIR